MEKAKYFLHSERIGFTNWDSNNSQYAYELWGSDTVTRFIGGPFSETQISERLQREMGNQSTFGVSYWPIFLLTEDQFIGCCGLRPYGDEEQVLEMGVHMLPEFTGKGLAFEATSAVIQHAFTVLNAQRLFAGHNPLNMASQGLLLKLGFEFSHTELYPPTGLMHPSYFLKRDDFLRR